jgi:uncharacterized membrane protein YeiH
MPQTIFYILDLIGVSVFAISGALVAGRVGMDFLGVFIIASVTAIGGGTLRDLLLNRHPIFWIKNPVYLIVIAASAAFTIIYVQIFPPPDDSLLIADALGLALFALSGAQIAENAKLSPIIVVLTGTMTGCAGGVIRDVLCMQIPLILQRDIYASAAIAGIVLYLVLQAIGVNRSWAFAIGLGTVVALRMVGIIWNIQLPVFHVV